MLRTSAVSPPRAVTRTVADAAGAAVVGPHGPRRPARSTSTLGRWGGGPAGGYRSAATRFPHRIGLVDDRGALTFGQVHERTNALAHALADRGVRAADSVAVLCRNHRGFVEATVAAAKLGADVLLLDAGLGARRVQRLLAGRAPVALVFDEEFGDLLAGVDVDLRLLGWHDASPGAGAGTLESLIRSGAGTEPAAPQRRSRTVVLGSTPTGTANATGRTAGSLRAAAPVRPALRLRHGRTTHVAAPLFHAEGWAHVQLSPLLGSTLVLRRHFDPFDCLETVSIQACDSLVVLPGMMRRILELPDEVQRAFPLRSVRTVAVNGSVLSGDLAVQWTDTFGDTLLYASAQGVEECIAGHPDVLEAAVAGG